MKTISKIYPRNCSDESGLFKSPPIITNNCEHQGINQSIKSFIEKVLSNKKYNFELNNASYTYELLKRE